MQIVGHVAVLMLVKQAIGHPATQDTRAVLVHLRDLYFAWLLYSTAAVAIGLLLEAWEIISDVHHEVVRSRRGYVPTEFNRQTGLPFVEGTNWEKLLSAFGWLLIVVGVCFEGWFESLVSKKDTEIQRADLQHITALDDKMAAAQDRASKLEEQARTLRERTENEIDARIALEKELLNEGPRYILFAGKSGRIFSNALRPFAGQKVQLVTSSESIANPEIQELNTLLLAKLLSAKWSPTILQTSFVSPEIMIGTSDTATEPTRSAAQAIAKALGSVGLYNVVGRNPPPVEIFSGDATIPADTVRIEIGAHMLLNKRAYRR